jgi:maltoporin
VVVVDAVDAGQLLYFSYQLITLFIDKHMKINSTFRLTALTAALLAVGLSAAHAADAGSDSASPSVAEAAAKKAIDDLGIQFWGYMRGGFYGASKNAPKGGYQLSGPLDHYRLGNEGDNYLEFGLAKKTTLAQGLKWGVYWMPTVYNGTSGNAQTYTDITGFDFAPGASFWGGQRYHRIQDVHIIDNWLMEDGDNYGAGVDDVDVGLGQLNVAAYSGGSLGNKNTDTNNAKRLNVQWHKIPTNPGGKLTLTAGFIRGDFAIGSDGGAFGALHNQDITKDISNSLFLQTSSGHADITGKFYGVDSAGVPQPGARQNRVVDAVNWQVDALGGQALVGYQTIKPTASGVTTKDLSLGGRVSYGISRYVKLLGEVGFNQLKANNADTQNLNKETIAVALSPDTSFWTRPEFRAYVTHANWNDAAGLANAATFGAGNRTSATTFGLQVEAWWK